MQTDVETADRIVREDTKSLEVEIRRQVPGRIMNDACAWSLDNLHRVLESRYDDPFDKKAVAFVTGRGFAYMRGGHFVAYSAVPDRKKRAHVIVAVCLYPIRTPQGMVYVECTDGRADCYTGHYFDRYAVRMGMAPDVGSANAIREEAIMEWLRKEIVETRTLLGKLPNRDGTSSIYKHHPDGMGIAVLGDSVNLFKTFVSDGMLRNNQAALSELMADESDMLSRWASGRFAPPTQIRR